MPLLHASHIQETNINAFLAGLKRNEKVINGPTLRVAIQQIFKSLTAINADTSVRTYRLEKRSTSHSPLYRPRASSQPNHTE